LQHDASMVVFRSVSVGLLLACFALLVSRPAVEVRVAHDVSQPATIALAEPEPAVPTIIDVAPGITARQLASTIHLAPGEQIVAVDDVAVTSDLGAGLLLASRNLRSRQFIDFSVAGPEGERRVLALLH
jgi:hypothetical protein